MKYETNPNNAPIHSKIPEDYQHLLLKVDPPKMGKKHL